ncbi:heme ABC transporter permease [Achromatium sp. WMS2]|nr:heme ABC transporter permease [Achromatium sp. WMS2]
MFEAFVCLVQRDLTIAARRQSDVLTALLFFIIVISLFPLGVGTERQVLTKLGPGVIWVAALLSSMLALEHLFVNDHADGTLEQILLTPQPLLILVLAKITAHWLLTGLPLVLIVPIVGLQYGLPAQALGIAVISIAIGSPVLSLVGAIGAALTLGLRGGGVLLSLLVLPLYIPILIYGAGAISAGFFGMDAASPYLTLLGAFLLLALVLAPLATAAALRISME